MKVQIVFLSMLLGAGSLVAPAVAQVTPSAAQDDKNPPKSSTARFGDPSGTGRMYQDNIYGVIKEVNANEIILTKTAAGTDQSVKVIKKTKFIQDGKLSSPDKFKAGDKVIVDVDKNKKTGVLSAKRVISGVAFVQIP